MHLSPNAVFPSLSQPEASPGAFAPPLEEGGRTPTPVFLNRMVWEILRNCIHSFLFRLEFITEKS